MNQNQFTVEVLVNGRPLKEYTKDGRNFIEARLGTQYSLRIRNNTWQQAEVIASIDGLDVITGEQANSENRGYLVAGYTTLEIKGFRESDTSIGSFLFTSKGDSYAQEKGSAAARNAGAIGIRIFAEKIHWYQPRAVDFPQFTNFNALDDGHKTTYSCSLDPSSGEPMPSANTISADYFGNCCSDLNSLNTASQVYQQALNATRCVSQVQTQPRGFDRGTSWGERKRDVITHQQFERGYQVAVFDMFYASRESLEEMGIKFQVETPVAFPKSFPGDYAKPPKGWKG